MYVGEKLLTFPNPKAYNPSRQLVIPLDLRWLLEKPVGNKNTNTKRSMA